MEASVSLGPPFLSPGASPPGLSLWANLGPHSMVAGFLRASVRGLAPEKKDIEAVSFSQPTLESQRASLLWASFGWSSHKLPPRFKGREQRPPPPRGRSVSVTQLKEHVGWHQWKWRNKEHQKCFPPKKQQIDWQKLSQSTFSKFLKVSKTLQQPGGMLNQGKNSWISVKTESLVVF